MTFADPSLLDLGALFRGADMFDSRDSWRAAGFQIVNRSSSGKIMVARHPSAHGLLFKRYTNDRSLKDQAENYESRVEGARRLRSFVEDHHLSWIAVPRKWILELPRSFSRREPSHVLVVEQLDVCSDEQTKATYQRIDPAVLNELCIILYHFRGMDSNPKNLPFVSDGRIGLIDTEHWDRGSSKSYLHHVREYLASDSLKIAKKIFRHLEDGDKRRDDFDDEEDTSSSSS
jgi:hypothetical protein